MRCNKYLQLSEENVDGRRSGESEEEYEEERRERIFRDGKEDE
jgi:hypothetical protein